MVLSSETAVGAGFTVMVQEAVLPFEVFAVMVAVPTFLAVTLPFSTVATVLLLLLQL